MPSIDEFFPIKWLKAEHIITADGRRPVITVEIAGAGREMLYDKDTKQRAPRLVVEFVGRDKRMVLNKTQAEAIANLAGRQYDRWKGQRIAIQAGTAPNGKQTIVVLPAAPAAPRSAFGSHRSMARRSRRWRAGRGCRRSRVASSAAPPP